MEALKYKDQDYWDSRYREEESYEWLCGFEAVEEVFDENLSRSDRILNLGCGNSSLALDLYACGHKKIVNLDYSQEVIDRGRQAHSATHPLMEWVVGDVCKMTPHIFSAGSFDAIIEKATLDSLLVGENPWSMSDDSVALLKNILTNIASMLTSHGVFISITFAQPHFRLPHYCREELGWSVDFKPIHVGLGYFAYVMRKGQILDLKRFEHLLAITDSSNHKCAEKPLISDADSEDYIWKIDL